MDSLGYNTGIIDVFTQNSVSGGPDGCIISNNISAVLSSMESRGIRAVVNDRRWAYAGATFTDTTRYAINSLYTHQRTFIDFIM